MNLVMGAVKGLDMKEIDPFLTSLHRTDFDGKVVFFVTQISEETQKALEERHVTLITVNEFNEFTTTPVNSLRYFIYDRFLDGFDEDISNIMVADVRDIIFQRDPFAIEMDDSLCCFLEDNRLTLATSIVNSGWLAAAYGKEILGEVGHNYVSCSGATLGPAPLMRRYLKVMTESLQAIDERVPNIMHVISGVDQAVHNCQLYRNALPKARLFRNEDGPILTLNYVEPDKIRLTPDGLVINAAGGVVHVVHQYDRHVDLARHLLERIGSE